MSSLSTHLKALGVLSFVTALGVLPRTVPASENREYAISFVYFAMASEDGDCEAINPDGVGIYRRALGYMGKSRVEIEMLAATFGDASNKIDTSLRGTIDGKPANVFLYPWSQPDPQLHIVRGTKGLGFNLDGKVKPGDFVDPLTGERGVDNQLSRALGCSRPWRSPVGEPGAWMTGKWDMVLDTAPAWLMEITGIDSYESDDEVQIRIMLARQPLVRDATGKPQADMTYTVEKNLRTERNVVTGRIVKGHLTTRETFEFYMPSEPWRQAEYLLKDARMRFQFTPEGGLKGYLGGYQDWRTIYITFGLASASAEVGISHDVPGHFYTFKKLADAYPDPETGQNLYISSTYAIEAIPAFIAPSVKRMEAGVR